MEPVFDVNLYVNVMETVEDGEEAVADDALPLSVGLKLLFASLHCQPLRKIILLDKVELLVRGQFLLCLRITANLWLSI